MTLEVLIGVGLFGLGLGVGFLFRRSDRTAQRRVEELELELLKARGRLEEHRDQVVKHFEQTSDLFRDLTEDYTALYAHLAQGARDLCPDRVPAIGGGFAGPLLEGPPEPGEVEPPKRPATDMAPDEIPAEEEASNGETRPIEEE
jgi:hypothetical protein